MGKMGARVGTADLKDDSVTSAKIKDGEIVNADIAAAAAIAYSKLATDPRICRVKTGTFTGDGTPSQAIAGVGFEPKAVFITRHDTSETANLFFFFKTASMSGEIALVDAGTAMDGKDNRLISLDSDGFTVDDDGADDHPNKNLQVYNYIAWG